MDTLDEMRGKWNKGKDFGAPMLPVKSGELSQWISGSMKKEQRLVFRYAVKTYVWSVLVFSFLAYLTVNFWGDWTLFAICMVAMVIYIVFTAVFMKRFKRFFAVDCAAGRAMDLHEGLHIKLRELQRFYRFKKIFDWLMLPASCAVIAMAVNKFTFDAPFTEHLWFNLSTFMLYSAAFIYVTLKDNVSYFKVPIKKLEAVIHDIEED